MLAFVRTFDVVLPAVAPPAFDILPVCLRHLLLTYYQLFAPPAFDILPAVAPPAFDILPAVPPSAFDILLVPVLFIVLLEEAPVEVEFDGDLPLVGFDMSPLGGVAAVIFG